MILCGGYVKVKNFNRRKVDSKLKNDKLLKSFMRVVGGCI